MDRSDDAMRSSGADGGFPHGQGESITFEGPRGDMAASTSQHPAGPSEFARQVSKLTNVAMSSANVAMSSAIVALFRTWSNPPAPPVPSAGTEALPAWYLVRLRQH